MQLFVDLIVQLCLISLSCRASGCHSVYFHESNMQHLLSYSHVFPATLRNVLFGQLCSGPLRLLLHLRLGAVMETLNIDAAIIQGHVNTALCL